ncbi:MAG: sigma-54-dependent Fis family transcriptional regulator [Chitinispirillaceae bacterium]|nr:sigma-54-dependent Fis family transcriptional regulator [Chitinispirillaceae bacterium]
MTTHYQSILIVEDDDAAAFGYTSFLTNSGYSVKTVSTLKEACTAVETDPFDIILLDLKLPDGNALHWIPEQKKANPQLPIIVITGTGDIPTAVQATKNGAEYFLTKPVDMDELREALEKCLELSVLRKKSLIQQRLSRKEEPCFGTGGKSAELLTYAELAARNDSVILLQGETGTGKGVLAKWIHEKSRRSAEAFVELNCSGLKGELIRSELYGHAKGAFTSAIKEREGLIEVADGGTLFLDEIGDMDLEMQSQLLKTIEEKSFRRIGENRLRKSDFRLICATNRDLLQEVKNNRFRSDLYYRICVFPVTVPALRERVDDIPGLAEHLLNNFGCTHLPLSSDVIELLQQYAWPGNVRELKNMLERALLLSHGRPLTPFHFPGLNGVHPSTEVDEDVENLREVEKRHILAILRKYRGDKKRASDALGMSFSNLYRRLQQFKEEKV